MKIALGADSAGKPLIDIIEAHLKSRTRGGRSESKGRGKSES